ncbi:MAG: hypothetical protein Q3M24_14820 [Candidatus Electrothrix aestuarii]|uniref:HEPN domain-containing protein n=1 Tax=Candidatus Electrothrix aestuarii TaxID=3062594 RepID=A0AAU8LQ16_9BACT|nr:hypothetical protein [Candidatus Electrothrix aestuarii]WPD21881.1 MAG: hypothetical protein SD837_16935 [Candidatus Electrothrix sp. GW3-3]
MITEPELIPLAGLEPIKGWEEFLSDGERYLNTATAAHTKQKKIFTPEILYNVIAMAIEKFVMAVLMQRGTMPYNHTMTDLVEAMESTFPGKMAGLGEGLLEMDKYQEICDLDGFKITPPGPEKIPGMLDLGKQMHTLVTEELGR